MQKNLQYNTIKCFHRGIYKVQWELGRGKKDICLGEIRDNITEEVAIKLRLDQ